MSDGGGGRGLAFEEFRIGATYASAARVVTQEDVAAFAAVSGDRNPLHLDEAYAAGSVFGRPVAHGVLGLAVATGLLNGMGLTRGTLVAFLGVEWDFVGPLYPGTEVRLALEVEATRGSSNPERGHVTLAARLEDPGGTVVQAGRLRFLVRRRTAGAAPGKGGET